MPVSKVPFVVIGAGKSAARHLEAARRLSSVDLRGVYDIDAGRAAALAGKYGTTGFGELDDLLDRAVGGFALISTPPATHVDLAERALRRGLDVLVEKPISVDLASVDRLMCLAARADRIVGAVAQHRFSPGVGDVRSLVGELKPGESTAQITIRRRRTERVFEVRPWRRDPRISGGGVLLTIGFHYIDLASWMFGPPSTVTLLDHAIEGGVDAAVRAHAVFGDIPTIIDAQWGADVDDRPDEIRLNRGAEIVLRGGCIIGRNQEVVSTDLHVAQLQDFAAAVRDRRRPMITPSDVRPALDLIFRVYRLIWQRAQLAPAEEAAT
jgi:predicted dehydrogenase